MRQAIEDMVRELHKSAKVLEVRKEMGEDLRKECVAEVWIQVQFLAATIESIDNILDTTSSYNDIDAA